MSLLKPLFRCCLSEVEESILLELSFNSRRLAIISIMSAPARIRHQFAVAEAESSAPRGWELGDERGKFSPVNVFEIEVTNE